MKNKSNLIALRDFIDKLIDAEQTNGDATLNQDLPVVAAWPDVSMIRVKDVSIMTHSGRVDLFGIKSGERYIQLKLA